MKKQVKRVLFSGLSLSLLLFLAGCVQTKNGVPTGEGWVYKFLVEPMGHAIKYFANDLGLGFGLAIILVTIIVRVIILPLGLQQAWKASYQAEKMAYLKPIFAPIQERMKNAQTQEEKLAAQSEFMAAQRENGVSMLGGIGCLPLFIQMPFFTALFFATRFTPGIADSHFLGLDLGNPSWILTITIAVLYFIQSWLSLLVAPEEQKQQMKTMTYMMPLMMIFMSMSLPAGVGLYWLVGGFISIFQQLLTNYVLKPKLRQKVAEEFEKNPPKVSKSYARKDVTPSDNQAIITKRPKKNRNAGKQNR